MDNIAKYLVRNPKQVVNYLKMLSAERCLISAGFGEGDKDTFLTAISAISTYTLRGILRLVDIYRVQSKFLRSKYSFT